MKKFKTIITYATIGVLCLNNFNSIFAEDESTTLDTNTENTIETPLIIDEEDSLHEGDQADTNLDENSDTSSDEENLEENPEDQEVHQNDNQENENNTESDETLTQGQEASDEEDESNNHDESNENNESNEDHNSSEDVESNRTNDTNSEGDENTEDSEDPENTDNQDNTEENLDPKINENTENTSGEGQNQNGDEDENQDEEAPLLLQSPQRNLLANPLRSSPTTFTFETITISKPALYTGKGPEKIVIMDRNLGATSNDITSEDSYGNYYQWGNNYGFHSSETVTAINEGLIWNDNYNHTGYYSTDFIHGNEDTDYDVWADGSHHDGIWGGENDNPDTYYGRDDILDTQIFRKGPCPEGYHVPSIGERDTLIDYRNITNDGNMDGEQFIQDFKLPLAGFHYYSSTAIDDQGYWGQYWSSSPMNFGPYHPAYIITITTSEINIGQEQRGTGIPIRCFKNYDPVDNSSKFTLTFDSKEGDAVDSVTIESGTLLSGYRPKDPVYDHHMLLGWFDENDQRVSFKRTVITGDMTLTAKWAYFEDITYTGVIDGTGIAITLMDRNLGATSNDINDPSSDGYYYQYGNNYGFEREKIFNKTTPITDVQVDIAGYDIDNPYYGETFYWNKNNNKANWATSSLRNLWGGGEDGMGNSFDNLNARTDRQGPCPTGYHIPSLKETDMLINLFGANNGISTTSVSGKTYPSYVGTTDSAKITLTQEEYNTFMTTFKLPTAGRIGAISNSNPMDNRYRGSDRPQFFTHVSSFSDQWGTQHSSFQTNNDPKKGIYLNNGGWTGENSKFAFPIRCFRNTAILPLQTVTRQDDEGNLITTGTVEFGKIPEFQGETPTKASSPQWTYTFSGRTPTPTSATGDVTYTALFDTGTQTYEIIFQDNNGNTISTKEYEYGTPVDQIETPNITITGGTFIRWDPTLTGVTTGMTYTPIYTLDTYTLTYELNSGVNHPDNPTTYTIESGDITLQEPTRTGYHFAGWTESGSTTFLTGIPQGTTGDKTLIAHWDPKIVHITLDFQGGTGGTSDFYFSFDTKKYYTDASLTHEITTITKPSKAGYTFQDFYSNNIQERFVSYEKNGTRIELNHEDEDTYYRISDDTTLIARWEPKIIHITLDPQGGTGGTQDFWFKYGIGRFYSDQALTEELTKIIRPTRTGYTFMNYRTEQERYVAYEDKEFAEDLQDDLTEDTTLKATWEANDYRIHFVNSDHPSEEVVVAMKYDQDILIPDEPFVKTGYTFKGRENEQGQLFQVGTSVKNLATTGDVLLKTKREEIPKRSFGSSGGLRLQKDYCPKGDFSDSYYDNTCEKSIKKDEKSDDTHGAADDEETNQLYEWAKETELTSTENVDTFRLDAPLTRSEMAKIVSIFLQKFLGQFADPDIRCTQFTDIAGITSDLHDYIIEACNLGIMGRTSDGEGVNKTFAPHNKVTKAEAVTILSRLFWGNTYQPQAKQQWYENHLNHLIHLGVITDSQNLNIPFTRREFYTALYQIYV